MRSEPLAASPRSSPESSPQPRLRLSIIVPVLDEAPEIPALAAHLQAIRDADPHGAVEVLVVDGGSSDGTRDALAAEGLRTISAQRGRGAQMNAGAAATRGDLLLFLHADSRLPDDAVELVRDARRRDLIGGFFAVRLASPRGLLRLVGRAITWRSRLTRIATGDQAIWADRRAFEELGGYAELPLFEDVDLTRRLRQHGRFECLPAAVLTSARRWEAGGAWRTILRMWTLRLAWACGVPAGRLARYYEVAR